jgi:hypothetical protein
MGNLENLVKKIKMEKRALMGKIMKQQLVLNFIEQQINLKKL